MNHHKYDHKQLFIYFIFKAFNDYKIRIKIKFILIVLIEKSSELVIQNITFLNYFFKNLFKSVTIFVYIKIIINYLLFVQL